MGIRNDIKFFTMLLSAMMIMLILIPGSMFVYADDDSSALSGDTLDGLKVRIRPAGSHQPVSVYEDGSGNQDWAHLFVQGKSSHLYLQKADDDSYVVHFYIHYRDAEHKKDGDCCFDIDHGSDEAGYYEEGRVIHVAAGNTDAMNQRWQFIPQEDGTYYIRNKLSGQYWSLENLDNPNANLNKLVQRKTPMKWGIEIVSSDNDKLNAVNEYDSRNFTYDGKTVTSTNWMGALPGNLKISDISIPGTHDSGACNLHNNQDSMSTQRYYIDELLNCGVRHLDLRTGLDDSNNVRIVHSTCHARNQISEDLTFNETLQWIDSFLETNPTETIILQIKMDDGGDECTRKTFQQLEAVAKEENSRIWAGDHVPTLDEVRGKLLVISRLDPEKLQGDYSIVKDGKELQWALDCHDWKDSKDFASDLTAYGSNYEVWTQDNWNRSASHKMSYIRATLFGNQDDGYTNGTMYRYNEAKKAGKDAWIFNYTSANNGSTENPFNISKDVHQWIYDSSDYSSSQRLVCEDTFTGIMAFDYMDGLMATKIYKTNFNRQYITIHGVTADGKEPIDPLTLFVGDESESTAKLRSDATKQMVKAHFNRDTYPVITDDNDEILSTVKASNQQEFVSGVQQFQRAAVQGTIGSDLYVHLEAPITDVKYEVEMPVCNTKVNAENPKVDVSVGDDQNYEPASDETGKPKAFIVENINGDTAFTGTVKGGTTVPLQLYLAPKWGFRFARDCSVVSDTTKVINTEITQSGELKTNAEGDILHLADYNGETPPSCVDKGTKAHYHCKHCKMNFFAMKEKGDPADIEASDKELYLPPLGHKWDKGKVTKEPTVAEEGLRTYTCTTCKAVKNVPISKLAPGKSKANPVLVAKGIAGGKKTVKISWNKVAGADRYVVYFSKCNYKGKSFVPKKVKTVNAKTLKFTKKKLKKKTAYKFYVVAQKKAGGSYKTLARSTTGHVFTGNVRGKYTNPKELKLSSSALTLKQGSNVTIKGTVTKVKKKKKLATSHAAKLSFISDNPSVASVNAAGKVTAKSKGTAVIYVQTINGIWQTCKVTVK